MKSKGWLVAIVLLILVTVPIWWRMSKKSPGSVASALRPKISVGALAINNIDKDKVDMSAKVNLSNPLPVELKTSRIDYQVLINDKKVLEESNTKPISVKSNDSATIDMPMKLLSKPFVQVNKEWEAQNADSATYTLLASIYLDVPVAGERRFDIKESKKLPAFRLIKIKPKDIDIEKFRWKKSDVSMDLELENPNVFQFEMKDVDYNIKVGDALEVDGQIPGITKIPAQSSITIPIQVDVEKQKIGKLAWKALFDKKDTPFNIDFAFDIVSKNEMLNNSKFAMQTNGTLAELKEAAKKAKE